MPKERMKGDTLPTGIYRRPKSPVLWFKYKDQNGIWQLKRGVKNLDKTLRMKAQAELRAEQIQAGLVSETDNRVDVQFLTTRWLAFQEQNRRPSTARRARGILGDLWEFLNIRTVQEITPTKFENYLAEKRRGGCAPNTTGRIFATLRACLNWGVTRNLIKSSPLANIRVEKGDPVKNRRALKLDEVDELLRVSPVSWRRLWLSYLLTGCRLMEVLSLRWKDLDLQQGEMTIRCAIAKGHRSRIIKIHSELLKVFMELSLRGKWIEPDDPVFPNKFGKPYRSGGFILKKLKECLTLAKIRWEDGSLDVHALRVTCGTTALRQGNDLVSVSKLLGHQDIKTTIAYLKMVQEDVGKVVDTLPFGLPTDVQAPKVARQA
jgi:site-specific recombinase XerD